MNLSRKMYLEKIGMNFNLEFSKKYFKGTYI